VAGNWISAQVFRQEVWVNSGDDLIIKVNNIIDNPVEKLVCSIPGYTFGDIGFSPNGKLYGSSQDGSIFEIDTASCSILPEYYSVPMKNLIALSFDEKGMAYVGSNISTKVMRVEMTTPPGTVSEWHDFGIGRASGDFIFLNDKMYIAWVETSPSGAKDLLYEVIVDSNNNYISHRTLGELPDGTWGLSSDGKTQLFCISSTRSIYSLVPPVTPVAVLDYTLVYTCSYGNSAYGGTSLAESLGNADLDFGDAPVVFPTADSVAGAVHRIIPGIGLGNTTDADTDGLSTPDADGDDTDLDGNDDDGIIYNNISLQNSHLSSGTVVPIRIIVRGSGYLNAWFDVNINGKWSDANEHVIKDKYLNDGTHDIAVSIPYATIDGQTFCRFRYSSQPGLSYASYAPDGEVEDYKIRLSKCVILASLDTTSLVLIPATCDGNTGSVNGLSVSGTTPLYYEWKNQSGTFVDTTLNLYHLPEGTYGIIITDGNGCTDSIAAFTVTDVANQLIETVQIVPEECGNQEGSLDIIPVSGLQNMLQYFLVSGNDTLSQWGNGFFPSLSGGTYSVGVRDSIGCTDIVPIVIAVISAPVSGLLRDTIYFDETYTLEATPGYDHYIWNTGVSTNSILITAEGWYKVAISTAGGCTITDSVMMLYAFVPLTMPNAFTPDGDGLNDVFRPVTFPEKISSFSMNIYDRWGKQVFFTKDVKGGWDGTINGNPAQIGGYVYVLKYGNPTGVEGEKRGMVTVVR